MTDIKPRIENGEPVCTGKECPVHYDSPLGEKGRICRTCSFDGDPCIPALRQQRDEAIVDVCMQIEESTRASNKPTVTAREFCEARYGPDAARRLFPDKETR